MVGYKYINSMEQVKRDWLDAFRLECSESDIRNNKEAKALAKNINKQVRKIDKCIKMFQEW
jgi:hypothetical protein